MGFSLPDARAREEVRISGTGGGLAGIRLIADAFNKTHPRTSVKVMPIIGSTGSIRAVIAGKLDLGVSGRPLKREERAAGANEIPYARTPFVFVAHDTVPVARITMEEAVDIYNGKTKAWPDGTPIRLILRNEGESDLVFLKTMSAEMSRAVDNALRRKGMIVAATDMDNAHILETTPGTLGTTALSLVLSGKRQIRVLALGGVTPSVEAISDGSYPFAKPFFLVTGRTVTPATQTFIDFVVSPMGASILGSTGHAVIPGS